MVKRGILRLMMAGVPVVAVLSAGLLPSQAFAESSFSDKDMGVMGQRFGKFMGSFMREMGAPGMPKGVPSASATGRVGREPVPPREPMRERAYQAPLRDREHRRYEREGDFRRERSRGRQDSPYYAPSYDPWGAYSWGRRPFRDDDWGGVGSWAERDWARGRDYYGAGIAPWENRRWGYGGGPGRSRWGDGGHGDYTREPYSRGYGPPERYPRGGGYYRGW